MERPVGVIIIAILHFLATAGLTLAGLVAAFGMGFLARILEQNGTINSATIPMLVGAGLIIGLCCFVLAALFGFLGYGMVNLRDWARTITMVLAILGIALGAVGMLASALRFSVAGIVLAAIRLAINGVILWYLNQPQVKAAFGQPAMPAISRSAGGIR